MRLYLIFILLPLLTASCVTRENMPPSTVSTSADTIAKAPYIGAIAVDAKTGNVVFEDNADAKIYPASLVKLMELLIILEKVKQGELRLSDLVTTETEAARTGGSQVFLRDGEQFTLDDLLYALMVHSANDAAVALAIHAAGSTAEFVRQMNQRAAAIGMQSTHFISVHGLPPANTITPDTSTPRDLSLLARELLKYPDTLRYTGCREKNFREGERAMIMVNHNRLLSTFQGCDGLKTGFFRIAGYSIVATALQNEQRFIVVVGGSQDKKTQYKTVQDLLTNAFLAESK